MVANRPTHEDGGGELLWCSVLAHRVLLHRCVAAFDVIRNTADFLEQSKVGSQFEQVIPDPALRRSLAAVPSDNSHRPAPLCGFGGLTTELTGRDAQY